jgi:hypothetical protein
MAIITAVAVGAAVAGTVVAARASAAAGSRAKAAAAQSAGAEQLARETNARRRERQANEILRRGRDEADIILGRALEVRSAQRAQFAAAGVLVDSGSAQVIASDTIRLAQADAVTTMFGAIQEAEEIRSASQFAELESVSRQRAFAEQGRSAAATARAQQTSAIIGGISSVAGVLAG